MIKLLLVWGNFDVAIFSNAFRSMQCCSDIREIDEANNERSELVYLDDISFNVKNSKDVLLRFKEACLQFSTTFSLFRRHVPVS